MIMWHRCAEHGAKPNALCDHCGATTAIERWRLALELAAAGHRPAGGFATLFNDDKQEAPEMMINAGDLVLVEVHGLPDNQVKEFTYIASYGVTEGQQVQVPAPDWSIRVTGRDYLPGFILGLSEKQSAGDFPLRTIVNNPGTPNGAQTEALADRWEAEAKTLEAEADDLYVEAEQLKTRARELRATLAG